MNSERAGPSGVGPRLAGRLTAELILRSPQFMNAIKLYELSLRGNKISAIENLGVTENQFDAIDLTDNAIVRLEGFPKLPRLKHLYLSNNRINRIAKQLEGSISNLELLMLANNRINNFQDIDPLATLPKLTHLCLSGNPVALKQDYRLYTISKLKHLKVLDFKKVKQKEREDAQRKFATEELQAQHAANTFEPNEDLAQATAQAGVQQQEEEQAAEAPKSAPTQDQLTAIKAAIASAQTLEEIKRLEEALVTGNIPSDLLAADQQTHANGADKPSAMDIG